MTALYFALTGRILLVHLMPQPIFSDTFHQQIKNRSKQSHSFTVALQWHNTHLVRSGG